MEQSDCFVCRKHRSKIEIPGGAIFEDEMVYVGSVRPDDDGMSYLGYVFVEPKHHAPTLADLTDEDGAAIGRTVARVSRALRAVLGVVHIYALVLGDNAPHVHIHLIGRYPGAPSEYWGIHTDEWLDAPRGDRGAVEAMCEQLRVWLAAHG